MVGKEKRQISVSDACSLHATILCGGVVIYGVHRWHEPLRHFEQGVDVYGFG
jgi:hypothetical protein